MNIKVGFDYYKYAMIEVEAKVNGRAMNLNVIELLYYATIKSVFTDSYVPAKQLDFEELEIMTGFCTIEECLEDAVKILRERVK